MRPNIQVRVYRPRQIMFDSDKPRPRQRGSALLSANRCKLLGLLVVAVSAKLAWDLVTTPADLFNISVGLVR